jgi:hypothetical protein
VCCDVVNDKPAIDYPASFLQVKEVQILLRYFAERGTFSLHTLKRGISKYMRAHRDQTSVPAHEMRKPDGLSAVDMFDPYLFQPGSYALHPTSHPLRPEVMARYHCTSCERCGPYGAVQPSCYFSTMLRCITHGWHPPCDYHAVTPKYYTRGNYPSVELYAASARKELDDMVANGVLIPTATPKIVNPMGAILKNSDRVRARVLVGVDIRDQVSLTQASEALVAAGYPKVKCRITTDLSATGVNRASYTPPFRYPSLGDALRVVRRDGYFASGDVSRYFHSFPLAIDGRSYWCIEYGGIFFVYARCCFGHGACPYYTSTWSAEFAAWARAQGLDPAFMVDDWFLCRASLAEAKGALQQLCAILEACGFAMSKDKFQYGQQVVFIGVLLDTVTMTMRFDPTQARGMRLQLRAYLDEIVAGRHLDHSTVRHVCGKLNWYSEIVQSGRMHLKSWWDYERNGSSSYTATLLRVSEDTQWWMNLMQKWESNVSGSVEYRILSASEIKENPRSILVIQSDASGTDGFGYYWGYAAETEELRYTARRWMPPLDPGTSSHAFELMVLEYFLTNECSASDAVLVWVTDNEGATWSINKGRCREPAAVELVASILRVCDERRLQIIAVWVPREENELADYLSHLAVFMDRDSVQGPLSDLSGSAHSVAGCGEGDRPVG